MATWSSSSCHFASMKSISCSLPPSPSFCLRFSRPLRSFPQCARTFLVRNVAGVPKRSVDDVAAVAGPAAEFQRNLLERSDSATKTSSPLGSGHGGNSYSSSHLPTLGGEDGQVHGESEAVDSEDFDLEAGYKMSQVCDRLIEVFMIEKTKPEEWRKLLAFSQEWRTIRPYFLKRCKTAADQETDPKRKGDLLQLSRKLKEVDDDMERHNELLAYVREHELELDPVVARRRKDFTNDFFHHLELLCQAAYERPDQRDDLARIAAKCLAAVEAHDRAAEDDVAISIAQQKFDDILNSPSLEAACNKIDQLAKKKQLDSTLMLLITKAWAASKESNMMKEEVKDIMCHLYMVARGNMQRLVPKEVRIMRHILSLEDPNERMEALTEAFSPGDELEGKDIDHLYTTPEKLHKWINIVLDAYYLNKQSTLMESARQLMNPLIIGRLQMLKEAVEDEFL